MGLNVYFSKAVCTRCLCWLTETGKAVWVRCGDLIQCGSKGILTFPSGSNSQHGISSGSVMCRAALGSCAVTAAETAAPGCYRSYRKPERLGVLWGRGWAHGSTCSLLRTEQYIFLHISIPTFHEVIRFVIIRCWPGNKVTKMMWKVAIFNQKVTKLPTLTLAVFTVDRSLLTCRPAAVERRLVWKYLPIPVTSIHIFDHHRARKLLRVPHTLIKFHILIANVWICQNPQQPKVH